MQASNATFLAVLTTDDGPIECVYKPIRGRAAAVGLPDGAPSDCGRWPRTRCPRRAVRRGAGDRAGRRPARPRVAAGLGRRGRRRRPTRWSTWCRPSRCPGRAGSTWSTGLDADDRSVSVIHADCPPLRRMAVFDVLVNNADRKGGHILGSGGRVFGVDHGVCFHTDPKLRTLLWGWAGAELTERELAAVRRARDDGPGPAGRAAGRARDRGAVQPRRAAAAPRPAPPPARRSVALRSPGPPF